MPHNIVGVGEILWDVFPDGPRFGGAPANFACSAARLGGDLANVSILSSVGTDDLGTRALNALRDRQVDTSHVLTQDKPTGTVLVQLDDAGCASYEFATDTAWDNLLWSDSLEDLASRTDAICFGTLGQRSQQSRETIQRFVRATPPETLRILDVNLRPPFVSNSVILESLELANVLKLNDEELPIVANLCGISGDEKEVMNQLVARFNYQLVALTRGEKGAVLVSADQFVEHTGVQTSVVDTVGAGDAFTAALTLCMLRQQSLIATNEIACRAAAHACSQNGGSPPMPTLDSFRD